MNAQQTAAVAQLRTLDLAQYVRGFLPNAISDAWHPEDMRAVIEAAGFKVKSAAPSGGCSMLIETECGYRIAYNGYVNRAGAIEPGITVIR